jgi:hypothetical protein
MNSVPDIAELTPVEIDPRPCQLCGLTIDQHIMIDDGEGPGFFCEATDSHAIDLVRQWELADPRDAWRHTGEPPPPEIVRNSDISGKQANTPPPYRTPQATVDAFWYVVSLCNPERLKAWLVDHPQDAPFLLKLLEGK